jgi:hypothetical protein
MQRSPNGRSDEPDTRATNPPQYAFHATASLGQNLAKRANLAHLRLAVSKTGARSAVDAACLRNPG